MVSVQQGISVTEALILLRAYAFSNDRLLAEVADDVVPRPLAGMNRTAGPAVARTGPTRIAATLRARSGVRRP